MKISQEYVESVKQEDVLMVRIMLKDSLIVDPTFVEFDELLAYAEDNLTSLYDVHDGEKFNNDISTWTKDYMDEQMVKVIDNFSKERIAFLKKLCGYLYCGRAEEVECERIVEAAKKRQINQKQVGAGLAIGGVATAIVGVVVSKPIVIGVGALAAVAGGILIAMDE